MGILCNTSLPKISLNTNKISKIIFSGQPPANQEIWVFGDELLNESKGWLKKLEFEHLTDNSKPHLYIHESYNVRTYQSPPIQGQNENFLSKIRNEFAETVQRKIALPSAILFMFSYQRLEDPVFAVECMEGLLRWLLDEIEDIIKFQKRCLPEKSKSFENPRVYFLKILPKPNEAPNNTLFKGVRRKFNNTLQNMLQSYHQFGFINVHEITTRTKDERFFISTNSGILSDEGTIQLWESISQTFKAIDTKKKPKSLTKTQATQWDPKDFKDFHSTHIQNKTGASRIQRDHHSQNTYYEDRQETYNSYPKKRYHHRDYYY